jgi:membrane dipeptidase
LGANKKYNGYRSWQFLEEGKDYKPFKLAKQVGRVPSKKVELSKSEEERAQSIIEKNIMISTHDHTEVFPEDPSEFVEHSRVGRPFIGYEGLAASGLDAVFENMMDGTALMFSPDAWHWENVVHQIGIWQSDIDHQDLVFVARKVEDIERAHASGKIAMVLSLEAPPKIGEDLSKLDVLYGLGVRVMGIVYSKNNEFGSGLADVHDKGLTDWGYLLVERLNKLGVLVDVSHASDKTSMEAIEASKYPVVVTHAGARSLWPSRRMKPDEVIQAIAEKKGFFAIEAAPHTTITKNHPRHSIDSIMEHFQYVEKLVGIDYVAFGPDTLFGDHVALHKVFAEYLSIKASSEEGLPPYEKVPFVDGLENPSEFPNIVRWLVKNGYSDQEIAKVVGGNVIRVLKAVWK